MNRVILMGRLTADPELRTTQSGISCARFTVAVDRRFADKSTRERTADFIRCVAWRQTADFITRYFSKGQMIAVEGVLRTGSYQDSGHREVTHYTTDVLVDNVEFCGSKNGGSDQPAPAPAQTVPTADRGSYEFEEILSDGDTPF